MQHKVKSSEHIRSQYIVSGEGMDLPMCVHSPLTDLSIIQAIVASMHYLINSSTQIEREKALEISSYVVMSAL